MLFVYPHPPHTVITIPDEVNLVGLISESDGKNVHPPAASAPTAIPYDDAHAPQQVKLVDLLQFLTVAPVLHSRFPLNVIVSAWDKIESLGVKTTPAIWLAKHLPLLDQFLRANAEV